MSDPLSVAGTAVGIASLGIQVCQGLIKYLQAVNDRNEEIKDAVRDVKQVLSLLDNLNNTLPNVSEWPIHKNPDAVNEISLDLKNHVKNHDDNSADLKDQIQSMQSAISDMLVDTKQQLHGTQLSIQDLDQRIDGKLTIVETVTRSTETNGQVAVAMLEKLTQLVEFQSTLMSTMNLQVTGAPSVQDIGVNTTYQSNYSTELCNDMAPARSSNMRPWQGCYCVAALPKSVKSFRVWNLRFQFEEQEHHLRSCKLWGMRKGTKRTAKAKLRMKLAWLSSRMIDACFEYASGTSRPGLSIRCRNIIPSDDSPVVQVIRNVEYGLWQSSTPTQMILILKTMEHEILNLYSKGLASPLDTTEDGNTHAEVNFLKTTI
ncbi:unnamed protein product [Fusarium graminearum]|nr:unnamed protein product [Fusarium graminearum]